MLGQLRIPVSTFYKFFKDTAVISHQILFDNVPFVSI